jgi:hypothetical protein
MRIFYIFLISLMFMSCKQVDTPQVDEPQEETQSVSVQESKPAKRIWNGYTYGLPSGVIVEGESDDETSHNWLSIRKPDGNMVLIKDVDPDFWAACKSGDSIQ